VRLNDGEYTLLAAPMSGFYRSEEMKSVWKTQMRLAFVAPPEQMAKVPKVLAQLFSDYSNN
jgi:hypothetical protein